MAYTFEELATWWSGKRFPTSNWTLVRTQDDGRTGYSAGNCRGYNPDTKSFVGQFPEQFCDRTRTLAHGPPATESGPYTQNFDVNAGIDLANFEFAKVAAKKYELRLNIVRWGATVKVILLKAAQGKVYTGWGPTIGNTTNLALYALTINAAEDGIG